MKKKIDNIQKVMECAACGSSLSDIRYGRYKDFCTDACRKQGRAFCKACGKPFIQRQGGGTRRDFCNKLCSDRFYRVGTISASYLEELNRSTCKGCGEPITRLKSSKRVFCSRSCYLKYKRTKETGQSILEKWGTFAPETRKVIREVEDIMGQAAAKRLASAIDREYAIRRKQEIYPKGQEYGKEITYICKGCGKKFSRREFFPRSKVYCTNRCQLKAEGCAQGYRNFHGEDNPATKLTWEQVDEIRNFYATKKISCQALGKIYNVDKGTIRLIIKYQTWKPEHDPRKRV